MQSLMTAKNHSRVRLGEGLACLGVGSMPLQDHPQVRLREPNLHLDQGRICQMKTLDFVKAKDSSPRR